MHLVVDPDELAVFLRGVRHTLRVIEDELPRTRTGKQARPTAAELLEVQRNLSELLDRPARFAPLAFPRWDGRAARQVQDWPEDNPVRRDVVRLWTRYTRRGAL